MISPFFFLLFFLLREREKIYKNNYGFFISWVIKRESGSIARKWTMLNYTIATVWKSRWMTKCNERMKWNRKFPQSHLLDELKVWHIWQINFDDLVANTDNATFFMMWEHLFSQIYEYKYKNGGWNGWLRKKWNGK